MKYTAKNKFYPLLALIMGTTGAFARFALYRFTPDSSGILPAFHPLDLMCWVLTGAFCLILIPGIGNVKQTDDFYRSFPKKTNLLPLSVTAACGILVTLLEGLQLTTKLHPVWLGLGFASIPAVLVIGWLRTKGKKPASWFYSILCLFYGVHLICCYQRWSGNPQTPDYSFQLLACVALILAAYHRSAFSAGLGRRKMHLASSLLAGFFCVMCCVRSEFPWLYFTGGAFFLADLTFRNKKAKPAQGDSHETNA